MPPRSRLSRQYQKRLLQGRRFFRWLTASQRVLPDFIIPGAMKAGTSTLYNWLCLHPLVQDALQKEVHFFDRRFHRGLRLFRSYYPTRSQMERLGPGALTGEASPFYHVHPLVPERIKATLPDVKFIFILRDPAARAYSHYQHNRRGKKEPLGFADALAAEASRLEPEVERIRAEPTYHSRPFLSYSYRRRGEYLDQIQRFEAVARPGHVKVVIAEELFADPIPVLSDLFAFLGLPPHTPAGLKPMNQGGYKPPSEDDRAALAALADDFIPLNNALATHLGRPLPWPPRPRGTE